MTRKELYEAYIKELALYSEPLTKLSQEDIRLQYEGVSSFNDLSWIDIYAGIEKVGFVLITDYEHCPLDYDYHIMETYIIPSKRKKGYVKRTLQQFVKKHPGIYGLYILKDNINAIGFWSRFITNSNVVQVYPNCKNDIPEACLEITFEARE